VPNFAPDPEQTVDVAALQVLQRARWTPQHRSGQARDVVATLTNVSLVAGGVMLSLATVASCALGAYVAVF
jgi:hypothetical protein